MIRIGLTLTVLWLAACSPIALRDQHPSLGLAEARYRRVAEGQAVPSDATSQAAGWRNALFESTVALPISWLATTVTSAPLLGGSELVGLSGVPILIDDADDMADWTHQRYRDTTGFWRFYRLFPTRAAEGYDAEPWPVAELGQRGTQPPTRTDPTQDMTAAPATGATTPGVDD
jgi:hypothetical protein